jgi:hypothetical protein
MNHVPVDSLPSSPAEQCYTKDELAYVTKQMRDRSINKFYVWTMLATEDKDKTNCLKPQFWEQKFDKDHGETNLILNRHEDLLELRNQNKKLYLFTSLESCCRCSSHMTWWARKFNVDLEVVATGIDTSVKPREKVLEIKNDACHWQCSTQAPNDRAKNGATVYQWYDDVNYNLLPNESDKSLTACFAATLPSEDDYESQTKHQGEFQKNWTEFFGKYDEKPWAVGVNTEEENERDVVFNVIRIDNSSPEATKLVHLLSHQMHAKDTGFKRLQVARNGLGSEKVPKMNQIRCEDLSKIKYEDLQYEQIKDVITVNAEMGKDLQDERIITFMCDALNVKKELDTIQKSLETKFPELAQKKNRDVE